MAGLLDYYQSPEAQQMLGLASGLLSAGGPSRTPVGIGQGLSQGLLTGSQLATAARKQKLEGLQAETMQTGLEAQKRTQAAIEAYAQQLPPEEQGRFLADPAAYIKAQSEPYTLSPGQSRFGPGGKPLASLAPNMEVKDAGGSLISIDPRTGQPTGQSIPKTVAPAIHFGDLGGKLGVFDVGPGGVNQIGALNKSMTPDAQASNSIARANLGLTALRDDPFNMFGARDIAGRAGAPMGGSIMSQPRPAGPAVPGAPVADPASAAATAGQAATGEDALANVPPQIAAQVKAMVEGRLPFPSSFALKTPYWQTMVSLAGQYEPGFDATLWKRRNDTETAFSKGKQGDALKAVNQTISHMGDLSSAIDKLDNFNGLATPLNHIVNPIQEATGDSRQGVFRQKVQAVSSELRKVFSGTGGGSLTELQAWEKSFPENASREQQRAYLNSGVSLLHGAIDSLDQQYRSGTGKQVGLMNNASLISPKAKATLQKLQSGESNNDGWSIRPVGK